MQLIRIGMFEMIVNIGAQRTRITCVVAQKMRRSRILSVRVSFGNSGIVCILPHFVVVAVAVDPPNGTHNLINVSDR